MHLEDFPMDAHACPLKFGSCKFISNRGFSLFRLLYKSILQLRKPQGFNLEYFSLFIAGLYFYSYRYIYT